MFMWNYLSPIEQGEFVKGTILIHGFKWKCYWKFLDRDCGSIEVFSEYGGWVRSFSHNPHLSNVFDWED